MIQNNTAIWCNGNTSVFGTEFIGSSPIVATKCSLSSMEEQLEFPIVQWTERETSNLLIPVRVWVGKHEYKERKEKMCILWQGV